MVTVEGAKKYGKTINKNNNKNITI